MKDIHYCDWASQPQIRIFCTQEYGEPTLKDKDLPDGVYEAELYSGEKVLYSFNLKKATCKGCLQKDQNYHTNKG